MAENLIGGVTAKVTSDNTQFDASWKQSQKVVETAGAQISATYAMNEKAAKKAAEAQAFAAQFAGDAVSEESRRMIALMKQEGQARADFRKAQAMARTEFQGEAEAANLVAAAYQRQTVAIEARKAALDGMGHGDKAAASAIADARIVSAVPTAGVDAASQAVAAATMAETAAKAQLKEITDALAVSTVDEEAKQQALAAAQLMVRDATRARMQAETELKSRIDQTSEALERQLQETEANRAIQDKLNGVQASPAAQRIAAATLENAKAQAALRDAQQMVAASSVSEETKIAALAPALARARVATIELAEANEALASASHHVVSGQQAASGAIRSLEGNAGLRAVENFISKTLGLGPALQAIFPIVGAIAFGQILLDIGKKAVDLEQKAVHAAEAIRQAFQDLHEKAQLTNDDLTIQNDKLQDEIDKLSGHPNSGLQTALDEARKMADQLLESLQADRKELEALLRDNEVGMAGSMLSGLVHIAPIATTGKEGEELLRDLKDLGAKVQTARSQFDEETAGVTDKDKLQAATNKRNAAVRQAYQGQIDTYRAEAGRLRKEQAEAQRDADMADGMGGQAAGLKGSGPIDNSAKIAIIEGRTQRVRDALARETLMESAAQREQTVGTLKQGKESAAGVDKAAEQRLKAMEEALNEEKLQYGMSVKAEFDYWTARQDAFKRGSDQYDAIVNKRTALAMQGAAKDADLIRKFKAEETRRAGLPSPIKPGEDPLLSMKRADAQTQESKADTSNELYAIQQRTQMQIAEMAVREQVGKTLTAEAGAMQIAAIHAHAYEAELARLEAKRAEIARNPLLSLGEADQQRKIDQLTRQIAEMESQAVIGKAEDAYAVKNADQSAVRGATDALHEFRMEALDSARQMHDLTMAIMEGVHKQLLNAVTGQKTDMRALGHDVATGVADMALKKMEANAMDAASPLLKKLGLDGMFAKKRDGSSTSTALYVIDAAKAPAGSSTTTRGSLDEMSKVLGMSLPGMPEYKDQGGARPWDEAEAKIPGVTESGGIFADLLKLFHLGGGHRGSGEGSSGGTLFGTPNELGDGESASDSGGNSTDALMSGLAKLTGGMFGGGKGDGSSPSTPLYVKDVGKSGAGLSGLGGMFGGSGDDSGGDSSGDGFGGGFFSSLMSMFGGGGGDSGGDGGGGMGAMLGALMQLPGFADGVDDFSGGPAIVGERGPELVNLPRGSSVTPNHKAFGGGDSGHTIHNHVHLHGDNWDRGQLEAVMDRKLTAAAPLMAAHTAKAIRDSSGRIAGAARR